jgi:uncharacterized protein
MRMLPTIAAALLALCVGAASAFALDFPPLTGRVVDNAGILNPDIRSDLADKSKYLEEKSGIQLVVATVPSLQGSDIETFANGLFRTWKLGQAQKNNGVLLLVAPNEHKVRIEVGYGLEGTMTDAVASVIISSAIVPRFKTGDFSGGVERGVGGILDVLSGDTAEWQPQAVAAVRQDNHSIFWAFFPMLLGVGFIIVMQLIGVGVRRLYLGLRYGDWHPPTSAHYVRHHGKLILVGASGISQDSSSSGSSSSSSWSSDSSSSSSDFSGGGGSSGGGGASGSW